MNGKVYANDLKLYVFVVVTYKDIKWQLKSTMTS